MERDKKEEEIESICGSIPTPLFTINDNYSLARTNNCLQIGDFWKSELSLLGGNKFQFAFAPPTGIIENYITGH